MKEFTKEELDKQQQERELLSAYRRYFTEKLSFDLHKIWVD
jgi:hypothetical protein